MSFKVVTGDLFESKDDAIGHGCNTKGAMASGIARRFLEAFPAMEKQYRDQCHRGLLLPGDIFVWYSASDNKVVYNLMTQEFPGNDAKVPNIVASVAEMFVHALEHEVLTISLPKIGCGIGGLDWEVVEPVLASFANVWPTIDLTVWELPVVTG